MQYDVSAFDDLGETGLHEVEAGDYKILLARDGGRVLATSAHCSHKGAPLKNGTRLGNSVICPWHHACFDLESGDHTEPPGQGCLSRFETAVVDGRVLVEVPKDAEEYRPDVAPGERRSGGERIFAIVGSGAAGLACAQELVRRGFDGRIVMFGDEGEPPYDRTALSKAYLQGKSDDEDLALLGDGGLAAIGVERITAAVARIDAETRTIHFAGDSGKSEGLVYDRCFAAPGSEAATLPLANADLPGVLTLRSHGDAAAVKRTAETAEEIVIVGSGFIGMEAAAALVQGGKSVTVIAHEALPFASKWGEAVAGQIVAQHREKGVTIKTHARVAAITEKHGRLAGVRLASGEDLPADLVLVAIGAKPRLSIFGEDQADAIAVGADLSVDANLYAGGDVAKFPLHGRGYSARIEHWRVAEQHGRHAARAMLGKSPPFTGVPFFWSAQYGPIHYVGHAQEFDNCHIEGDLEAGSYTAFYIQDDKVVAALGRGKADVTADLHGLMILSGSTPSKTRLEAVSWQPAKLL
ncbi:FAD-dependent oxidoreductase [Jiella sp. MQZ9-1]|uniref:FAD-dependent oxidoreductase n=1 Tax=Jiella flava TaxID=2816857 RepID=A0A939FZF0_9HYPH|nr:FAD-dependent oxidoreductase [Jiella flava]MBO0662327.1 FAD-dependent oxidoreductase [Jiella flava]MCD2470844.1 FAD-dependent oxidoreductase [Jiella flava]